MQKRFRSPHKFLSVSLFGFFLAFSSQAEELTVPSEIRLSALVNISDGEDNNLITSILDLVSLFESQTKEFAYGADGNRLVDFVFVSEEMAISNGRLNTGMLDFFDDEIQDSLGRRNIDSDRCYVDKIFFENGHSLTLGVFNDIEIRDHGNELYLCLTVALRYRATGEVQIEAIKDWRRGLIEILRLSIEAK